MKINSKYSIGDEVWVYDVDGLIKVQVFKVVVIETKDTHTESYQFSEYGNYYAPENIKATNKQDALKVIKKNESKIQLMLEM